MTNPTAGGCFSHSLHYLYTNENWGEICIYCEMGGMLLEQVSRNSHSISKRKTEKMNAVGFRLRLYERKVGVERSSLIANF